MREYFFFNIKTEQCKKNNEMKIAFSIIKTNYYTKRI